VTQEKRLKTFSSMKNGHVRFIVATNVAARGLDIPNVEMVIQCSPPKDV
jgi:ATP-dependent RNA helicase DDX21